MLNNKLQCQLDSINFAMHFLKRTNLSRRTRLKLVKNKKMKAGKLKNRKIKITMMLQFFKNLEAYKRLT